MKNIKYFLLSFLVIVLFSKYSSAQMILSNVSSEREIPNTSVNRMMPVKTENWDDKHIVSLVHYGGNKYTGGRFVTQGDFLYHKDVCAVSAFYLTERGTTSVEEVKISGHTITDFCIVDDYIFICGQDSADNNFFAYKSLTDFFDYTNTTSLNVYYITNNIISTYTLTNIDFCFSAGQPTLLLLANQDGSQNSLFTHCSLVNTSNSAIYSSTVRLLDITQTNSHIAVLGMEGDSIFTLTSHDINNIQNYNGAKFNTNPLYDHFTDSKYHLSALEKELNHIVVGESVTNTGWMEFNRIDLNTLDILYTQATVDTNEGRAKIVDLEFDKKEGILYCLFCNGINDIRDMILRIDPYIDHNYSSSLSKPQITVANYNLFKDLTLYKDYTTQLLVLGRTPRPGLNIYFFDRISDFEELSNCDKIDDLSIEIVKRPRKRALQNYTWRGSDTISSPISVSLHKSQIKYNIICN
jgi:hypothetical protein